MGQARLFSLLILFCITSAIFGQTQFYGDTCDVNLRCVLGYNLICTLQPNGKGKCECALYKVRQGTRGHGCVDPGHPPDECETATAPVCDIRFVCQRNPMGTSKHKTKFHILASQKSILLNMLSQNADAVPARETVLVSTGCTIYPFFNTISFFYS